MVVVVVVVVEVVVVEVVVEVVVVEVVEVDATVCAAKRCTLGRRLPADKPVVGHADMAHLVRCHAVRVTAKTAGRVHHRA